MKKGKWLLWALFVTMVVVAAYSIVRQFGGLGMQGVAASFRDIASNIQGAIPSIQGFVPNVQGWLSSLQGFVPNLKEGLLHMQSVIPNIQGWISNVPAKEWMQQAVDGSRQMRGHGQDGYSLSMDSFLVQASLFVVGWVAWKLSKGSKLCRWLGAALMVWGAALLLPKILLIPFILTIAYFTYKIARNGQASSAPFTAEASGFGSHTVDYLDEWEKQNI
jgi:hypothetical protein